MYLDETVTFVASVGSRKERKENLKVLLNMISKNDVVLLSDLWKERLPSQGSSLSFRNIHLSVPRSRFSAGG